MRYQQDPAHNMTYVEADLAGDSKPDLCIQLCGLQTLTAANFALTAAQSTAALANGAALSVSTSRSSSAFEYSYTNLNVIFAAVIELLCLFRLFSSLLGDAAKLMLQLGASRGRGLMV